MMCMPGTEVFATLHAGVYIPYGKQRVADSTSQTYLDQTHNVFLLRSRMSRSSMRLIPEDWMCSYPTFLVRY